jgi:DNA mismatch endonuclease (patch repair protein)
MGWRISIIWECALKGKEKLDFQSIIDQIDKWLNSPEESLEIRGKRKGNE